MNEGFYKSEASEDFNKARGKEALLRIFSMLWPQKEELLSFEEVRALMQPKRQSYRGLQTISIKLIVGSEGRYKDFNKSFLPRKEHLRNRWTRVDEARLSDIILPPIQLYELGGVYFVRDGNHRVSVAKSQGCEAIDAEVISLDSRITLYPKMTREDLYQAILDYEYESFLDKTNIKEYFPESDFKLTCTGRYDEIMYHIFVHKYYANQGYDQEIPFSEAVKSWYHNVYKPIAEIVEHEGLLAGFPGKTISDLYVWVVKHWHFLKEKYGDEISAKEAAVSYFQIYGKTFMQRFEDFVSRLLGGHKK